MPSPLRPLCPCRSLVLRKHQGRGGAFSPPSTRGFFSAVKLLEMPVVVAIIAALTLLEIGLIQRHANAVPAPSSGGGISIATYGRNVVALQISGFGGNVKIYRR